MGTEKAIASEVVITGIGVVTPLENGSGLRAFWDSVIRGEGALSEIESFDASAYASRVAGEIKGLKADRDGRWSQLLKTSFLEAVQDAGLEDLKRTKAGLVLGTVLGGISFGEKEWRKGGSSPPRGYHLYSGANALAESFGVCGPVSTVSTACASGTDAIGLAYRSIFAGKAEMMVAGGGDMLSEFAFSGFNSLNALTRTSVKPFDVKRDGLALGEGAAFVVLEKRSAAEKRGARIYCRLSGYSSAADANHMTGPDREGRGLARAITNALKEAGLERVDYINAHGTGTPYNDLMETKAFKRAFGAAAYGIPVSSVKGSIGHAFGAAGAIEAAICALAIVNKAVPPTVNLTDKDPECDLDYVPGRAREVDVDSCLSVSAGFGGQNSALVMRAV